MQRKTGLTVETLMNEDILNLNARALAEQAVGQELSAYQDVFSPAELYFWARDKKNLHAEVGYIINIGRNIIPIEVKAGKAGHLKSLQLFLKEYNISIGIKISSAALSYKPSLLSIPLYILHQLPKLYTEVTGAIKISKCLSQI